MNRYQEQFDSVMLEINEAIDMGRSLTYVNEGGNLYPEVAEMLADLGYDVKMYKSMHEAFSQNIVSWVNFEINRRGTIELFDELLMIKQKPKREMTSRNTVISLFLYIRGVFFPSLYITSHNSTK